MQKAGFPLCRFRLFPACLVQNFQLIKGERGTATIQSHWSTKTKTQWGFGSVCYLDWYSRKDSSRECQKSILNLLQHTDVASSTASQFPQTRKCDFLVIPFHDFISTNDAPSSLQKAYKPLFETVLQITQQEKLSEN